MGKSNWMLGVAAVFGFLLLFVRPAFAVVSDVSFTGGGIGAQTIQITNEETKESESGDRRITGGGIFIPLEKKKWRAGSHYTITFNDPRTGKPVTARNVELKDGPNRLDLDALLLLAGGSGGGSGSKPWRMPDNVIDVHLGFRFFDLAPVGPSFALRADYTPPIAFAEDVFTLRPYVGGWVVPGINVEHHRPYDDGQKQLRIKDGSIYGINAGLKHVSDLRYWGFAPPDPDVSMVGIVGLGIGWIHYAFDTERVENLKSNFAEASDHFKKNANGFRMELNVGVAYTKDHYFLGLKGGVAPTVTDVLNLDTQVRWEGNISFVGGLRF